MQRRIFLKFICFSLYILSASTHAAPFNACLAEIDKHAHHAHFPTSSECWLNLSDCQIKDDDISQVINYAAKSHFKRLELSDNQITAIGATQLAIQLPTSIYILNLDRNHIAKGVIAIAQNNQISQLSVKENNIDDESVSAFSKNYGLFSLDLSDNNITNEGLRHLAKHTHLGYLYLANNKFDANGLRYFIDNNRLQFIDVSKNNLYSDAALVLSKLSKLEHIVANDNFFGDQGIIHLAMRHQYFYWLELQNNHISNEGAKALARISATRLYLWLEKNYITAEGARALAMHKGLEWLKLKNNNLDDEAAISLAKSKIHLLDISKNKITDKSANALAANCTITQLDVRHNHFSKQGITILENSCIPRTVLSEGNDG